MKKTVILVGLGHCHVQVARNWNRALDKYWKKIVICPDRKVVYSGMVTGCIAGDYQLDEASIDVESVCKYFGWTWIKSTAYKIIPDKRTVRCRSPKGTLFDLFYDVLSINVGSETLSLNQVAVDEHVLKSGRILTVRPVGALLSKLEEMEKKLLREGNCRDAVVVVGGSYTGVEVAFCLESRLRKKCFGNDIHIIESEANGLRCKFGTLPAMLIGNTLKRRGIRYEDNLRIVSIKKREIWFENDTSFPYAFVLLCTGAKPPELIEKCDALSKDTRGFIKVFPTLQTVDYPNIFACGDCCSFFENLPKAGVYAVRQGAILTENIRLFCESYWKNEREPQLYQFNPQKFYLSLLSTGDRRAIGMKYGLACYGRCLWKLKDKIDRDWIDRVNRMEMH